jgi:spermidine synthase
MASGPAVYGKTYLQWAERRRLTDILRSHRVLFYRDGPSGTVSVTQEGPHVFLRVNGKMDAGTDVDMPTQMMSGHLPLLLHPGPRAALVIGLGSGITAGAVSRHPVERLDVVEIEPAVVEASAFFAAIHGNVLEDPRVRTVIADGRNFLLTTPRRYDVIVSEPSNPWIGGVASLFSVEFFRLARERLAPGGIMLQWLQGYGLHPDDLRMVVQTFRTAFPATSVWNTIRGDYLLLGRLDAAPVDLARLKSRYEANPGVWRDLDRVAIRSWPAVLGFFMLAEDDAARFAEGAGLNTDDRLPLEFSAPRALYLDTADSNWELVRRFRVAELPAVTPDSQAELERAEVRYGIGAGYLSRRVPQDAWPQFQRALELDPSHAPSLLGAAIAARLLGRPEVALDFTRRVLDREPANAEALFQAGLALAALNRREQAIRLVEQAAALQPQNGEFRATLGRLRNAGAR